MCLGTPPAKDVDVRDVLARAGEIGGELVGVLVSSIGATEEVGEDVVGKLQDSDE